MALILRNVFTSVLFFHLFSSGQSQEFCPETPKLMLLRDLFCSYYKYSLPVDTFSPTVHVEVATSLRRLELDEHQNILYVFGYTIWRWIDINLMWDRNAYGRISEFRIESEKIWNPDVRLFRSSVKGSLGLHSTLCKVYYLGRVMCVPPIHYRAHCNPDITKWPFDTQNCSFTIGAYGYFSSQINFTLGHSTNLIQSLLPNREWLLENATMEIVLVKKYEVFEVSLIVYTLIMKRHSEGHAATVVVPAFVLATLTLLVFFMEPSRSDRLAMCSINVLAHCLYLQYLGEKLPGNGNQTPLIIIFFRDSLFLVGAGLVLTVILRALEKEPSDWSEKSNSSLRPPDWLNASMGWLLSWRVGQFLLLSRVDAKVAADASLDEDGSSLVGSEGADSTRGVTNTWRLLGILLNRAFFLIFCVVFFILLTRFIPS